MAGTVALYISSMKKGGAERVMSNLAGYLVGKGYRVVLVTTHKAEVEYEVSEKVERRISEPTDEELQGGRIRNFVIRFQKLRSIWKEEKPDAQRIVTEYRPVKVLKDCTLLEVCLITGRSHQIRAHLASVGYPIIGDYKYGIRKVNDRYQKNYGLSGQLLHSCRLELPDMKSPMENLSGRVFTAPLPDIMKKIIKDMEKET